LTSGIFPARAARRQPRGRWPRCAWGSPPGPPGTSSKAKITRSGPPVPFVTCEGGSSTRRRAAGLCVSSGRSRWPSVTALGRWLRTRPGDFQRCSEAEDVHHQAGRLDHGHRAP